MMRLSKFLVQAHAMVLMLARISEEMRTDALKAAIELQLPKLFLWDGGSYFNRIRNKLRRPIEQLEEVGPSSTQMIP